MNLLVPAEMRGLSAQEVPITVADEHLRAVGEFGDGFGVSPRHEERMDVQGLACSQGVSFRRRQFRFHASAPQPRLRSLLRFAGFSGGDAKRVLMQRSMFATTLVQQLISILEQSTWTLTPTVLAWLRPAHQRLLGTQVIEGAFKSQRVAQHSAPDRKPTLPALMLSLLQDEALGTCYHFEGLRAGPKEICRGVTLSGRRAASRNATSRGALVSPPSQYATQPPRPIVVRRTPTWLSFAGARTPRVVSSGWPQMSIS